VAPCEGSMTEASGTIAAMAMKGEEELLRMECEVRGLPLRHLATATPKELESILLEAERLDEMTLEELRMECHMHGFAAAGTRTPWGEQAELAEVLMNVFIWKRMDLPDLQQVCRERNLTVICTEQHSALLSRLAMASWEDQGLPWGAFSNLQAAQELLDQIRSMEGLTWTQLRARCCHRSVPFTRVMSESELLAVLRLEMIWSQLPVAFLQRACLKCNIQVQELADGHSLREELLLLLVESLQADVLEKYRLPPYLLHDCAMVRLLYMELQELEGMQKHELANLWSMTVKSVTHCFSLPCHDKKGIIRCLLLVYAWRSLMTMEQLRRLCVEGGIMAKATCRIHTKSSLVACLFEQTFIMEWEALDIPARRLGYKTATALLERRGEIGTLRLHRLRQLYWNAGLPIERRLERRAYVKCLQWLEVEKFLIGRDHFWVQDTAAIPAWKQNSLSNSICRARDLPESRLGGNFPAIVKLARRHDAITSMGTEELHRECRRLGVLQQASSRSNNLRHWLGFHALLHALTWDELLFECLDRGLDPEEDLQWWGISWFSTRQYLQMRDSLERRCLLHECLSSLEAEGLPAHQIGALESVIALSNCLEKLESMADTQLKEKYRALGLPGEEDLDRQSLLAVLKQWEVWKLLPLAELKKVCVSRGMREVSGPWCCVSLQDWLLMGLSERGYARRGVPVKRLASLANAAELARHFGSLEALDASGLADHCLEQGLPLVGNLERDGLLRRLKELAKWDAFSEEELRAECRDKALPLQAVCYAQRHDLRDMLLLDLCRADFEQKGISVETLGSFASCSSLAKEFDDVESMPDDKLRRQYTALGLLVVGLPRQTIIKRLQDVARWTAGPLAELQATCRAYGLNTIARRDNEGKRALAERIAATRWKRSTDLDPFPDELPAEPPTRMDLQYLQRKFGALLPEEGWTWSWWEVVLFFQSRGHLHPDQLATKRKARPEPAPPRSQRSPSGRISVAVITSEARHHLHEQVWRCFEQQTWHDKELVVVDTWVKEPSPFFSNREDARLVYASIQVPFRQSLSLGFKRNVCTHLASGMYIAHFDDDDIYAPRYLDTMLEEMCEQGWDAITLRSWYIYDSSTGKIGHADPRKTEDAHDPGSLDAWEYGYGFSYMYTREIATRIPYSDVSFDAKSESSEDWPFFERIRKSTQQELGCLPERPVFVKGTHYAIPGPQGVALLADDFGLCLHVMHSDNLAQSLAHRRVPMDEAEALEVRELEGFEAMLQSYRPRHGTAAASSLIPDSRESRSQELLVRSAARNWQVCLPAGSTVKSLRLKLHSLLQASQSKGLRANFDLFLDSPVALRDQERIPLRTKELRAA